MLVCDCVRAGCAGGIHQEHGSEASRARALFSACERAPGFLLLYYYDYYDYYYEYCWYDYDYDDYDYDYDYDRDLLLPLLRPTTTYD